jgi:hypothetical protein
MDQERMRHRPIIAAALALICGSAAAQTSPSSRGADQAPNAIRTALGAWDLELVGASRLCTVTFGAEEVTGGRQLRFPAICRRALPILDQIGSWSLTPSGQPRLNDAGGKPVLSFAPAGTEKALRGQGPDGKSYGLNPKGPRLAARASLSAAESNAQAAQRKTAVDPATMPAPETLPGRYIVMRQQNREACRLNLQAGPATSAGNAPAAFEGSCGDTGLTIFDPAGWRYASGRLTLVARKGHSVELVFENGQWRKDPAVGAPLLLRKAAP